MLTSSQNIELFMQYTQPWWAKRHKGVEVEYDFFLTNEFGIIKCSTKKWAHSLGYVR